MCLAPPVSVPHVWRTPELAHVHEQLVATGHARLDIHLPGGGWPVGSLVELLQEPAGPHVWQLLLPALAQAVRQKAGPVVLVAPPFEPFIPSLAAQGLPGERLLCVKAGKPSSRLWAAEQALRCADVVAVMAWLPRSKSAELRRLHLAAQQHDKLLFVMRGLDVRNDSSPARIRLLLEGTDTLQLRILKRRGPPLDTPIELPAHSARVAALLAARQGRATSPSTPTPAIAIPAPALSRRPHVLDRAAALP
nr:translesion DNA synthesis-associated protein ImuA [Caenimonas aquaedulcis]